MGASPAGAQEQTGDAVVAWGNDGSGQSTAPPDLSDVRAISAGGVHGLAIRDLISPTVTAVKPADDATGIEPGTNVSAFFSGAMTTGSIDYDGVANRATLDPNADLRRGDRYRVKVPTGTKDLAGNRLDQGPSNGYQRMVWRFTVGN